MECLAATAITIDMGIEQNGLGLEIGFGVFYEVKPRALLAQRNSRRPNKGPHTTAGGCQAVFRRFIPMKLGYSPRC